MKNYGDFGFQKVVFGVTCLVLLDANVELIENQDVKSNRNRRDKRLGIETMTDVLPL